MDNLEEDIVSFQEHHTKLQEAFEHHAKLSDELHKAEKEVRKIQKDQKRELNFLNSAEKEFKQSSKCDTELLARLRETIQKGKELNKEIDTNLPSPAGLFAGAFIGPLNVRLPSIEERRKYKDEYENFKLNVTTKAVLFSIVIYFFPVRMLELLYQLFVLYVYASAIMREHILSRNGSNIMLWWIAHHYITLAFGVVLVTWPETDTYASFRVQFFMYAILQGVVAVLQHQYQKARLYKLRALGEIDQMEACQEVVMKAKHIQSGKTIYILIPTVLFLHCLQIYNGITLFSRVYENPSVEWQVHVLGCIFLTLGVGNMYSTLLTVFKKQRYQRKKNQELKKQQLQQDGRIADTLKNGEVKKAENEKQKEKKKTK